MNVSSYLRVYPFRRLATLALAGAMFSGWLLTPESHSQAPVAPGMMDARTADTIKTLVAQIKAQQDQMAENQTKIEAQAAALKEELRLVKIYSARGGSSQRR